MSLDNRESDLHSISLLQLSLDAWEVRYKFRDYWVDGLHFEPPNPKNLVFQSIRGENVIFLCIFITGSMISFYFFL